MKIEKGRHANRKWRRLDWEYRGKVISILITNYLKLGFSWRNNSIVGLIINLGSCQINIDRHK